MTTRTSPSPIEIIADSSFRLAAEAGAAVIAFDAGLNEILFADEAGRVLLGLSGAAPSPALRQVRSAARGLAETGRARVLLRRSTRAGTRMVEAELALRPADGARPAFALMTVAGLGRPLGDADLLAAADLLGRAAAIFADGTRHEATATFADHDLSDLAERVAEFESGPASTAIVDQGSVRLTLARAPFGRILVSAEAREIAVVDDVPVLDIEGTTGSQALPSTPVPAETPAGFASFSVKRSKLGEPRSGMSMGALLQRWHSRGPEADAPENEAKNARQADVPDGRAEIEAMSDEAPAEGVDPVETQPVPPLQPVRAEPMRSRWGTPDAVSPAEPAMILEAQATGQDTPDTQDTPDISEDEGKDRVVLTDTDVETVATESAAPTNATPLDEAEVAASPDAAEDAGRPVVSGEDASVAADLAASNADDTPSSESVSDDAHPAVDATETVAAAMRPAFVPRFDVPPVRFVWQIDRDGAFRFLSPDFAGAVGPHAADVVGRSFATVARVFGFDETREIARLLERRDTWSGRTIFWPVEGSDRKVPVDLAALPVYGRDRSFDGFRGFGIVRLNEAVPDEEALGLHLTTGPAPERDGRPDDAAPHDVDEAIEPQAQAPREKPFLRRFEAESFGRRAEPPATQQPQPDAETDRTQKVIRLEERRRPRDGVLSTAEEAAFRAIGAKLGSKAEAESPGALRFEEPAVPVSSTDESDEDGLDSADETGFAPEAEPASVATDLAAPSVPSEPNGIEPALEALSEKLARAEAEADRRLAARRTTAQEPAVEALNAQASPSDVEPADEAPLEDVVEDRPPEAVLATENAVSSDDVPAAASEEQVAEAFDEAPLEETSVDDEEAEEPPLDMAVFERLFAGLPLAVLVQVGERTIYTNSEFASLTGHADAAAVEAAGGLDALVLDRQGEGTLALLRADGEIVEVHAHMQRIAEGGRSALLMSFSRVVDEEAASGPALDDLRQEVEELQAVLDTATDGVVLLDINGNIRAMNGSAHALFGIGADEAFGRHLSSLFAHESQKATVDYLEMLRDDGIGGILNDGREVIGRVSQGGFIPLFITIGRLSGERGWCVVIRDIAHWKRIEEDLVNARRQAEAASLHKSRFLANISHELRTPLNAIIGFADVMSSECFGPIGNERYLEYLGDIKRSGHHVLDLVNDLLDISKIEAGKIDLSFEAVALNEVISEAVSLMQPQANRERVIVRSNLPSSVPPVVADRRTVRQIALNLLANAIRFTPAGGQIIASTTYSAEGDVLLRFRDSGIGMTEREIELALTPFQQVHAPSANRGEGTGLGLPLTKAMVEANRAYFSIQSTPGEGTLVEIVFPAPRVLAD